MEANGLPKANFRETLEGTEQVKELYKEANRPIQHIRYSTGQLTGFLQQEKGIRLE